MQSIVQGLTSVPGVMGGMLADEQGNVLAHSFPAFFDHSALKGVAELLMDNTVGLQEATGGIRSFDLRYELGRVIIKPLPRLFLLILCQPTVNIQLLLISLNVGIKKLEKLAATQQLTPPPAPAAQTAAAPQPGAAPVKHARPHVAPVYSDYRAQTDDKGVILTCEMIQKTAGTFWSSMSETCSVNRNTALEISNFFDSGPFKKLTITNVKTGASNHVPVNVIQHDRDHMYDGKILLTLALSEHIKIKEGDEVRVEIVKGGGMFGWEGI